MRSSTIHEIKQELLSLKANELVPLCLRLAKYKKENKELLTYLLFEAHDEESYVRSAKQEIEELFETINLSQLYFVKKTLRKIVRVINKHSRYSGNKQTDMELRIFFLEKVKETRIPVKRNALIANIYKNQLKKIHAVIHTLHEDLQHDYSRRIQEIESF